MGWIRRELENEALELGTLAATLLLGGLLVLGLVGLPAAERLGLFAVELLDLGEMGL